MLVKVIKGFLGSALETLSGLQKQDTRFRGGLNQPATGGEQLAQHVHISRNSGRNGGCLLPVIRERPVERGFRNIHRAGVRTGVQPAQAKPFRVAEDMVHPLLATGRFQPLGETEEVRLLHNIASGGTPDVIQFFSQLCPDAE